MSELGILGSVAQGLYSFLRQTRLTSYHLVQQTNRQRNIGYSPSILALILVSVYRIQMALQQIYIFLIVSMTAQALGAYRPAIAGRNVFLRLLDIYLFVFFFLSCRRQISHALFVRWPDKQSMPCLKWYLFVCFLIVSI